MSLAGKLGSVPSIELTLTRLTITIVILALSWCLWTLIKKGKKIDPSLPPGPRGLPLVGNLLSLDPELHTHFASLGRTYGPILSLRLGKQKCIVITSPSLAKEVLKDHDAIFANHPVPAVSRAVTYGLSDIVSCPNGPEWRMLRKVCVSEMLNSSTLSAGYSLRRRELRNTIADIYNAAGSPVKLGEKMFMTALNATMSMLWGNTIQGRERDIIGAEFLQAVTVMNDLLAKPNISDFFPGLAPFDLQGMARKMKEAAAKMERIFEKVIDRRRNMDGLGREGHGVGGEIKDFVQVLLQLKDQGDAKTPLTMSHVKALLTDMVIGGTDSSAAAIEFAIAEMMNKPEVMRKAQEEVDMVIGKNSIVEESDIYKLPYLQAVMKEVLRLHPGLPLMVPHCPTESCIIGGYTIPRNASVFVNVWAIHRDASIWKNPSEFNPERFLNGEFDFNGNDFNYLPFGSGRRICAGLAMAERTVMFSLASLLHSFDWKLPEAEELDLSEKFGLVLRKKIPLMAIPTPRLLDPKFYN